MKKPKWTRKRHKVSVGIVKPFFTLIARFKYHAEVDRFAEEGKRNYLILSNHQTDFDQFFLGLSFKKPLYYVAMEDLFSNGFISRALEWLVAPIPILKASTDIKAVKTCMRVAREGGNIALFPEGNRTYSGRTCYIKPGVASLAKALGLPIAIYKIEGGYGVKPRWADDCRKGKMKAGVRRVIEPEEYKDMSKEELYSLICNELWVDESGAGEEFISRKNAEGLERVIYVCEDCGLSEFSAKGDIITCKKCGKQYRYLPDKRLEAVNGSGKFSSIGEWYSYQEEYIRSYDVEKFSDEPIFCDSAKLLEVIVYKHKKTVFNKSCVKIFKDRLEISGDNTVIMPYDEIKAMACVAGHKLNVFYGDKLYQLKGDKTFNVLKYCNIYYHAKYVKDENLNGKFQFLGL